jgi:DNA-binding response OmpR family regulator
MSVLIVDDDPSFLEAVSDLLTARGFAVAGHARNGAEALEAVKDLCPDAVLLDVRLPDSDAFHLARRFSELERRPIMLFTSSDARVATHALAVECGAVGFVPKAELAGTDLTAYFPI